MSNNDRKEIMFKEIDLIQSCITRMAQNSFMVKGWLITLITVVFALLPEKIDINLLCFSAEISTCCFWFLDAFFLRIEKLYRMKYEWVIKNRINSDEHIFDLNPYNSEMWLPNKDKNRNFLKPKVPNLICIMFSKTLLPMYMLLIVIVGFVSIVNLCI